MITKTQRWGWTIVLVCAFIITAQEVSGAGMDYPNDSPVTGAYNRWPNGMVGLVNSPNRVRGFFVNREELFFFSGTATNFSQFLQAYSQVNGIDQHSLILHAGKGEAKAPWDTKGKSCDWKLYGCPKSWHNLAVLKLTNSAALHEPGYVLEVHFWTNGPISLDQVSIPKNITLK
jgi:hypothetical protein